jgi:hypothetical protein
MTFDSQIIRKVNILVTVEEYEKWGFVFFFGYLWSKISLSRRKARFCRNPEKPGTEYQKISASLSNGTVSRSS